jgi:hypothetical protein
MRLPRMSALVAIARLCPTETGQFCIRSHPPRIRRMIQEFRRASKERIRVRIMICSFVRPSIPSNNIITKLRKLRSVFPSVCNCAFQRRRNVEKARTLSRWNFHLQVLCQSRSRGFIADVMMASLTSSIVSFSPPGTRDSSNAVLPCVISCRSTLSRRLKASKLMLSVMFRFWSLHRTIPISWKGQLYFFDNWIPALPMLDLVTSLPSL